ncbi:MAG: InlB B-repeat-containing protein, partial [Oscillospiraceae bacterium]|nr:InlB B-repeat-containing protein [Oscillospiraceae bacterium]
MRKRLISLLLAVVLVLSLSLAGVSSAFATEPSEETAAGETETGNDVSTDNDSNTGDDANAADNANTGDDADVADDANTGDNADTADDANTGDNADAADDANADDANSGDSTDTVDAANAADDADAENEDGDETAAIEAQLQALIDALPTAEEVNAMDSDGQNEVYAQVSDIWDAYYDDLTEDEQAQVDISALEALSDYFNGGIMTLENEAVAQIGDTIYATLDEAVAAAADGDTIIVLADCETAGLNLSKALTIKGAEGVNPTITFNTYGIALWGKALTFEDCTVQMNNITSTPYTAEWNWMAICASTNASLTLNNVTMNIIADSTSTNNAHCIYFCSNNKLNLNNSTLVIKNYKQDALEWDGGDGGYNINIVNSTFISDHNRSGFTGTFYATITDSTVQVINSLGNGSNGSHFIITNSTVDFSNNASHGLSTGILTVTDSTITANNNGLTGIIFNNTATFKNSTVTITGTKGTSYWNAGMRAYTSNASCTIDADCAFTITDNYVTGIFLDADTSLTIEEGASVLVTRNEAMQKNCSTKKDLARSGGGIVVRSGATATLSSTTLIYNNHAAVAGDDIYLESETSSITFSQVKSGWKLDGTYLDETTHCTHPIDGWYNDGYTDGVASARWEADAENADDNYISLYTSVTATGILALKAAHGLVTVTYEWVSTDNPTDVTVPSSDTISMGTAYTSTAQEKTAQKYVFAGWYTDKDCTIPYVDGTELVESITLYGKWTKQVDITYEWVGTDNPTDVTAPDGDTIDANTAYDSKAQDETAQSYVFDGWYLDEELTVPYEDGTVLTEDITLYGKWTRQIVVDYVWVSEDNPTDVTTPDDDTVDVNAAYDATPQDETEQSYVFDGWYLDEELPIPYEDGPV